MDDPHADCDSVDAEIVVKSLRPPPSRPAEGIAAYFHEQLRNPPLFSRLPRHLFETDLTRILPDSESVLTSHLDWVSLYQHSQEHDRVRKVRGELVMPRGARDMTDTKPNIG